MPRAWQESVGAAAIRIVILYHVLSYVYCLILSYTVLSFLFPSMPVNVEKQNNEHCFNEPFTDRRSEAKNEPKLALQNSNIESEVRRRPLDLELDAMKGACRRHLELCT